MRYQLSLNDWHIKLGRVYRYGLAILLFAVALAARLLILPVEAGYAFITFYPLIVVAFYLCNRGPGLLVIILCAVFSYYIFTPPFWVFSHNPGSLTPLFIFLFSSSLIGIVVSKMHYYHNALSLSQQRYGGMLEDQTETICRFKADGEILYVNDAFCRFFSKSAEAVIGTSWQPIVIEEDLEQVHAKLNTLSPLNPVVTIENRVVTANGEIRWGQFINRAFFDQYSNLLQIQSVGRDITEQKQTELVNRELYNRLTLIASRVPGVIYQYKLYPDGTSCFPYASEGIRDIYRITPDQVMSDASVVFKVIHPDDYEGVISSIQQSVSSLEPWQYDYRVKFADETIRWLSGNSIPALEADGSVLWHGYITDITAQKQIEIALKQENEKNAALLQYASDGITIMNISGTLLEVSDTFCNMLGYAREEMIGMHVSQWDIGIRESELMDKINAQFEQPVRVQFETLHRRKDGTIYDAEISGYPIQLNGQPLLFNSTRDITERKLLEAKLIRSGNEILDLYNRAPCGYHSLDSEGLIIQINDTELKWLGYERDEVIGKMKITDFFTTTGKEQFRTAYPEFIKRGPVDNLEFDLVSKKGNIRHVSTSSSTIRDNENNFVMSRSVLYDITEIKKIQNQLKCLTDEQQTMLDNELIGIVKVDARRITWINSAMLTMFGYDREELKGQFSRILYPDDAAYEAFGDAVYPILNSGSTYRTQIELVRKDKEKIWMDISGSKLPGSYNESLWMMLDITPHKKHQLEVEEMAYHDILTGLPNRLLVEDRIKQALAQAERANQLLAVCYLDLDGFKPVNDQYGHAAGDKLLIELARRMEKLVRGNDTVGRIGGDEFVLLLTNLDTADDYRSVLNRVIEEINTPFLIDSSTEVSVGASIGVTLFPNDGDDADILLRHSDQAMYQAKRLGRNRICEHGICINN